MLSLANLLGTVALAMANVNRPSAAASASPPKCEFSRVDDYGTWDHAILSPNSTAVYLHRGDQLLSLAFEETLPAEILRDDALVKAKYVAGMAQGAAVWLIFNSPTHEPFVVGVAKHRLIPIHLPPSESLGAGLPIITFWLPCPRAGTAFFQFVGGDHQSFRPVWMKLATGETHSFPVGWTFGALSADEKSFAFETHRVPLERHPQAVSVATGKLVQQPAAAIGAEEIPVLMEPPGDTRVRPVYRTGPGGFQHLTGFSVQGEFRPFPIELKPGAFYPAKFQICADSLGVRLRRSGNNHASPLYVLRAAQPGKPIEVSTVASDYALPGPSVCVYLEGTAREYDKPHILVQDLETGQSQDAFEGIQGLPPLPAALKDAPGIRDEFRARLFPPIDPENGGWTLCNLNNYRKDELGFPRAFQETLSSHTVLISAVGKRFRTDLFLDTPLPAAAWLHRSGTLLVVDGTSGPGPEVISSAHVRRQKLINPTP